MKGRAMTVDLGPTSLTLWGSTADRNLRPGVPLLPFEDSEETWTPLRLLGTGLWVVKSSCGRIFRAHPTELVSLPAL